MTQGSVRITRLTVEIPLKLKTDVDECCDFITDNDNTNAYTIKRFVIDALQTKVDSTRANGTHKPRKTLIKRGPRK